MLPRGAVVHSQASEQDLARLEAAARAQARAVGGQSVARSEWSAGYLQALCELLHNHGFNAMGTCTFTDAVAYRRFILSPLKAVQVVAHSIAREAPFRGSAGFRGKLFVTPEWHRTGREVPHVHFTLKTRGNPDTCCKLIRIHLSNHFGRSTCEVMHDQDKATLYGLKDTLKESAVYPNAYYLALRERAS